MTEARRISGTPVGPVTVASAVLHWAGRVTPEAVWRNELGGLTFRARDEFLKWAPAGVSLDLAAEEERLRWASTWTPVPGVVSRGSDEEGSWLVTRAMPGRNAVDPYWLERPTTAARQLGVALRALHDAVPVEDCPFDWGVAERAARVGLDLDTVGPVPPVGRLVVCHGDACAPNTLLADDGTWTAHVDLGRLGAADLWADLAVAAWSTEWNYGPGYEACVYEGYGIEPDAERIAFYRRLWDVT